MQPEQSSKLNWLVNPIEGKKFIDSLTAACRGNNNAAMVMRYFLYEAACEADRNKIDIETVEYITIKRELKQIIAGVKRSGKEICPKTLIARITNLQSYKFIKKDGYRHTYEVHFKEVREAFKNTPEPEKPKLRGRHTHKDCNFNNEVKPTIHAQEGAEEIVDLRKTIVNLQSQIVDLSAEIVNLQSQIVNLQSYNSSRDAREAALDAKIETLFKLSNINLTTSNINSLTSERDANAVAPQVESEAKENNVIELSSRKTSQPSQRKTSNTKKTVASMQLTLPDLDAAPTLESILQAGDYIRGFKLAQKDMKACREGAQAILQQKKSLRDIVKVLAYMSTRDEIRTELGMKFKDDGYLNGNYQPADLCNIYKKMDIKLKEIARLENTPAQDTPQAHHVMPTTAAEKPLNETPEEAQARRDKHFRDRLLNEHEMVFWTTTGDMSIIKNIQAQPLEVLETWAYIPTIDAIDKYGLIPRKYGHITGQVVNNIKSRIMVLKSQVVSA